MPNAYRCPVVGCRAYPGGGTFVSTDETEIANHRAAHEVMRDCQDGDQRRRHSVGSDPVGCHECAMLVSEQVERERRAQ